MNTLAARSLSDSECQQVHETSLRVLEQIGVDVQLESVRAKLLAAGAKAGSTNTRVLFPKEMIVDALKKCDRQITLSSVRKARYPLDRQSRYYSSCMVDPFMLEYRGGPRPPKLADCVRSARLVDGLDLISMPYKMDVVYSDVPEEHAVVLSNYALMANMSKHYIFGPHNVPEARIWMEMCQIMAAGSLREDRIVSALVSPISPLTLDKDFLELVEFLAPLGIMLILLPCPMSGATSPFSLAGTVVTYNCENLAALTTIQTLWPGSALMYHNVSSAFSMRSARSSLGGPEKILCCLAGADMGRFYDLPCGTAGSSSDSPIFDAQNGAESMGQLLLAVSGRATVVTGVGSLGGGNGTSVEQILLDCDLIALARYLTKGITVDEERLAFDSLEQIGPGGNFLTDELTMKLLRSDEHFHKGSFDRSGTFESTHGMYESLHERAEQLVKDHKCMVPEGKRAELEAYVRRHTKAPLPEGL